MSQINRERPLAFSDDFVQARLIENVEALLVSGIVVNLSHDPLVIGGPVPTVVPAWKSASLLDAVIASATRIAVFRIPSKTNIGGLVFGKWDWFGNHFAKFPRTTPLYISEHDVVGEVHADPFLFSNTRTQPGTVERYALRLNLWWSPAETDCYIHNEHPFLEIHTQIFGTGRIQCFHERDEATLYREITMAPGYTHDPFVQVTGQRDWQYPWHRYYSDSDAIWLAIELHPISHEAALLF
jgi:hypothetical protein